MFAAVRVFKVSTRMCTIKNKMAEGFLETKIFSTSILLVYSRYPGNLMFAAVRVFNVGRNQRFLEMLTQTREPSCSDLRLVRALLRSRVPL